MLYFHTHKLPCLLLFFFARRICSISLFFCFELKLTHIKTINHAAHTKNGALKKKECPADAPQRISSHILEH